MLQLTILMMSHESYKYQGVAFAWQVATIAYSLREMAWTATELSLFKSLPPHQKCSVLPDARKKNMFCALARVSFSAAKIVSCNNKKYFHGLPSKLLQLFYFIWGASWNFMCLYQCIRRKWFSKSSNFEPNVSHSTEQYTLVNPWAEKPLIQPWSWYVFEIPKKISQ
jgi:hypothetical protein